MAASSLKLGWRTMGTMSPRSESTMLPLTPSSSPAMRSSACEVRADNVELGLFSLGGHLSIEVQYFRCQLSERNYNNVFLGSECALLGKTERVKAPTALPTAMESATCRPPGLPRGGFDRGATVSFCGVCTGRYAMDWAPLRELTRVARQQCLEKWGRGS